MAVHVRYNSSYISLPSCAKQQREMTNSALSGEREPRRLFFDISVSNLTQCSIFSFENDLRVSRES